MQTILPGSLATEQLQKHAQAAADLLKKMSNPHRLLILCTLAAGELSVTALNQKVPLSQSALSQHLACLRKAKLVQTRKDGQTVYYQLQGDSAIQVIAVLQQIYCPEISGASS